MMSVLVVNNKQPALPQMPKKITAMDGKFVTKASCNSGTSALVTSNGELYLFGKDSSHTNKDGYVWPLEDQFVVDVALGKAHVVVLTREGHVWTAGVNYKGQCGRNDRTSTFKQSADGKRVFMTSSSNN